MAKDPAFLFYPNDYIGGTMGMTFEEKGAYMELLMLQFNRGHMTSHMIGQTIGQLWDNVKDKFIQDEKGLWYNRRLEEEQNRRKHYTESRRNNIKGVNQYTKKRAHMTSHMENENENENINRIIKGGLGEKIDFTTVHNIQWMESISRNKRIPFLQIEKYWDEFQKEMEDRDDLYRTPHEYRKHFSSWVNVQNEKNGKGSKINEIEEAFKNV